MKKAIVIGSTGMIGLELVHQLLRHDHYESVTTLSRRSTGISHPKLQEHLIDFDKPETWTSFVQGDVLFSTLGTTQAKEGSKEGEYKVDYVYQLTVAEAAVKNGVPAYVLVSSAGANPKALSFYMKTKGQLDEKVNTLPFKSTVIMRPGQLDGERLEKRSAEKIGLKIMYGINKLGILRKIKPIHSSQLAKAMITVAGNEGKNMYTLNEIFKLIE
jgi:uncharacterized protein YbjT (DUF2867 family)